MVKDVEVFDCRGEMGVDKGVKVGVECLEDGDGTFVRCPRFVNERAAGDFEGFWEETGGEDERDEALDLLEPDWVET